MARAPLKGLRSHLYPPPRPTSDPIGQSDFHPAREHRRDGGCYRYTCNSGKQGAARPNAMPIATTPASTSYTHTYPGGGLNLLEHVLRVRHQRPHTLLYITDPAFETHIRGQDLLSRGKEDTATHTKRVHHISLPV